MEIRVLRYFLAIAREGSISNAANVLHVTQPTLSRQIKDLEEQLGQKLLIRKSHCVQLTQQGMFLRKRAQEIIALVDKTQTEFQGMEQEISGEIYIGSGETVALKLITDTARELRHTYPGIHYHVYSGNFQDVTERLDKGLLDFGLLIQPADLSKYNFLNLPATDIWGVVMRQDSPLAQKKSVCRQDLFDLPLIVSRQVLPSEPYDNEFTRWFGVNFDKLDIVATYNLAYNAAIMVQSDLGYTITLDKLVDTSPESGLCFRPLTPKLEAGLSIVWKKHPLFSSAAQLFLQRLYEKFL